MTDHCLRCKRAGEIEGQDEGKWVCWQCRRAEYERKAAERMADKANRIVNCRAALWPKRSYAMGCPPEHQPEMRSQLESVGVKCDFDPVTGDAILLSRRHRRDVARAMGLHDKSGGYSDP